MAKSENYIYMHIPRRTNQNHLSIKTARTNNFRFYRKRFCCGLDWCVFVCMDGRTMVKILRKVHVNCSGITGNPVTIWSCFARALDYISHTRMGLNAEKKCVDLRCCVSFLISCLKLWYHYVEKCALVMVANNWKSSFSCD